MADTEIPNVLACAVEGGSGRGVGDNEGASALCFLFNPRTNNNIKQRKLTENTIQFTINLRTRNSLVNRDNLLCSFYAPQSFATTHTCFDRKPHQLHTE